MRKVLTTLRSLLLVALAGCSVQSDPAVHQFEIRHMDGVRTGVNRGGPRYDGELFRYEKILEIRGDESDPESLLYGPGIVVRSPDGRYFVADGRDGRVAIYDGSGSYLGSFGQKGRGPGEFESIMEMKLQGDRLLIEDFIVRRTSLFDLEGQLLGSVTHPPPTSVVVPQVYPIRDGRSLIITSDERRRYSDGIQGRIATILSSAGDTLSVIRTELVRTRHWYPVTGGRLMADIHFSGNPVIEYGPGHGLVVTTGIRPVLDRYDLDGSLRLRVRIEGLSQEVTAEDRARVIQALDRQVEDARPGAREGSGALRPEMARGLRENAQFADRKAVWDSAFLDAEGFVWLHVPFVGGSLYARDPRPRFRVLSPDGEYLGVASSPAAGRYLTIGAGFLMQLEEEPETGLRVPTVYRMTPIPGDLVYPGR